MARYLLSTILFVWVFIPTLMAQEDQRRSSPRPQGVRNLPSQQRPVQGGDRTLSPSMPSRPPAARANQEEWPADFKETVQKVERAWYRDADRQDLPYLHEVRPLAMGTTGFSAHLTEVVYEVLPPSEVSGMPGLMSLPDEPLLVQRLGTHRKQPHALVDIYPYRKNTSTGQWERMVSYVLQVVEARGGQPTGRPKSYPPHSRLANGEWYRVQVVQDGVHQLTYEQLRQMGLSGEVPSDQLNVYGHHHGLLPFQNSVERPTDLWPNAIAVEDGGDGLFGPGDRILFHASGPHRWDIDPLTDRFVHTKHVYSDSASYFIGIGVDPALRIATVASSSQPATRTSTSFDDRQFIERDLVNLLKSGRQFFGETYDLVTTHNYNFDVPFLRAQDTVTLVMETLSRTIGVGNSSQWRVRVGSALDTTVSDGGVSGHYTAAYGVINRRTFRFQASGNNLPITVTFTKHNPVSSIGYMNSLAVNLRRELRMAGNQMHFMDRNSAGPGEVTDFVLEQASTVQEIWDVTDPYTPLRVETTDNGTQKLFRLPTDTLRRFVAFRSNGILTPSSAGRVNNQDLHATALPADLVIICPPEFRSAAQALAERRAQEGLSVVMIGPQEVYNEFSSGARDATAIKRYMRMLYEKADQPDLIPRFLLLFGDGSYNNLNRALSNQSWIPTYQTANSHEPAKSYTSDDYFGLLDPNEGEATSDLVDIGIGRLPVSNQQQANEVVAKILNYDRLQLLSGNESICSETGDQGASDWRNRAIFASDDQDGDGYEGIIHMSQSDQVATLAENAHACLDVTKIYLDAYQQVSTPGGQRYPQANADLRDRVQKGALLVNYVGHGGEVGWAHERFLDVSTILGWSNGDKLPLFMTATCEFSRWDDPNRTSAGEYVLLNPKGGGIGLMTTTRIAYSSQNFALSQQFYQFIFNANDELGRTACLGDAYRRTKKGITTLQPSQFNHRNFALLGDPSMRLAMPRDRVEIISITDTLGQPIDTIMAMATIRITGRVVDGQGQPITGFNGVVVPTVFDKRIPQSTLVNDGQGVPFNYTARKNIIYRGRATVTNGEFSFTFVVPRDIAYQVGPGRISVYLENYQSNACGATNDPLVGSTAGDVAMDEIGPDIRLFMNDERFVRGGITDESPMLVVKLFDMNGINTMGSSIGHDLVAVLNENTERAIVLNDLYEADLDTYRSGTARYRFKDLPEGGHTLRVKAWDVFNNSSESNTEFIVSPSAELALAHVLNYPNPFTTHTQFFFEHNRPCSTLDVQVQVFTVGGRLVKTLNRQLACEGYRAEPMAWDGRDDHGDRLARGVYVYRLHVATPEGDKAEKFEKLVILR